ncbi:MAG: uroporphyrinogen decarboxylase family protein [Acetobacterium sp.]|nr:uroporphyrinogen decarboxylase family protein [Bacillota bacterium]MCG2731359.1 uroporphyrinogen decarboxylase family protein [Acetobacterium sp.]
MTHKEILLSGIALKETPRLPVMILSSGVWTVYRNGLTLQNVLEDSPKKIADCIINDNTKVESDVVWVGADCSNVVLRALGAKCTFNLLGEASTMDEPLISKPSDVDKLNIDDLENSAEIANILNIAKIVAEKIGDEYLVAVSQWGPFTLAGQMLGMDKMMVTALKDKPGLHHIMEFTENLLLKYWNLFIDAGVEMVNQAEPLSSGDVISARLFEEMSFPHIKSANQAIEGRVKAKALHICGNTTKVLDLIPLTKTDLFSMDYKVDLKIAKEKLAGKVAFGGQLDPTTILLEGTPKEIEAASLACIEDAGQIGYVLIPGCDIPPQTKMENVQAMIKTAHNYKINK